MAGGPTGTSTGTSALTGIVAAQYEKDFLLWAAQARAFADLVNWKLVVPADQGGGSSFNFPVFSELAPATTALTETNDVSAVAMAVGNVTVTPYAYGNAVGITELVRFQTQADVRAAAAKALGQNQAKTVDLLCRTALDAGTSRYYALGVAARTALGTTSHLPTYDFITQLVGQARALGITPFEGDTYVSVINAAAATDIMAMNQFQYPAMYQGGMVKQLIRGEIGMLGGLRFISSPHGKLYLSGGLTAQAATTIDTTSVAAGGTTLSVASSTGLAAGSYITVGALEDPLAETVQVTAQSTTSLTIRGKGNVWSNAGFANSHAASVAVTEAAHVMMIPILGKDSLWGVHGATDGKYGSTTMAGGSPQMGDVLGRWIVPGWKWYGGASVLNKYTLIGEAATKAQVIGALLDY
jgi:N4-gp56 family major capsid protein